MPVSDRSGRYRSSGRALHRLSRNRFPMVARDGPAPDLVQNLEQSNPGLQSSGRIQDIQVNGLRGRAINLRGTSPIQQNGQSLPERDWLIGLPRPEGGLLYIVFVAPENQFSQLSSTYQAMLNSLQIR